MLFDDGTGECLIHAEGSCVLSLLKKNQKGSEFEKLKEDIEAGCRQYGIVRYDSYFSHWSRMDFLNSLKYENDPGLDEGDAELNYISTSYITVNNSNNINRSNTNNDSHNNDNNNVNDNNSNNDNNIKNTDNSAVNDKNNAKINDSNDGVNSNVNQQKNEQKNGMKNNFYQILSPAHNEEKMLENYLKNNINSSTLKLQVKIIPEKFENKIENKSENKYEKFMNQKKEVIDNMDIIETNNIDDVNDENDKNDKYAKNDSKMDKEIDNTALNNLQSSISNINNIQLNAKNIKIQANNDDRQYSISFISLPTLHLKNVILEAVSVIVIDKDRIRLEAWKHLKTLKSISERNDKS